MLSLLFVGCNATCDEVSVAADVNTENWNSPATLTVPNSDTVTSRDMALFVRYNEQFAEDTLTVRIAVQTPDTVCYEEPFVWAMRTADTPAPLTGTSETIFRRRVQFDRTGDYSVTLIPTRAVEGVEAVGVHFTQSRQTSDDRHQKI